MMPNVHGKPGYFVVMAFEYTMYLKNEVIQRIESVIRGVATNDGFVPITLKKKTSEMESSDPQE